MLLFSQIFKVDLPSKSLILWITLFSHRKMRYSWQVQSNHFGAKPWNIHPGFSSVLAIHMGFDGGSTLANREGGKSAGRTVKSFHVSSSALHDDFNFSVTCEIQLVSPSRL